MILSAFLTASVRMGTMNNVSGNSNEPACLVCGKKLAPAFGPKVSLMLQPLDAVAFEGTATYGSKFDGFRENGEILFLNICDDCIAEGIKNGRISRVEKRETVTYIALPEN